MMYEWMADGARVLAAHIDGTGREGRQARERAAVAALLAHACGSGLTLAHRPDGAPYVPERPEIYISVSHSWHYAAIALAPYPVGIDVEEPRGQLLRVAPRVLSEAELSSCAAPDALLEAWTVKEALYKLHPSPDACDFRARLTLNPPSVCGREARILLSADLPDPPAHLTLLADR